MMKPLLSFALLASAASLSAQAQNTVLKADTAMTTHSAGGNRFSSIFITTGDLFGTLMDRAEGAMLAEDFTIPAGATWAIDSLIVYGYQTGGSPATSSYTGGYFQIFNSSPAAGGAVVAGDTTTNRFASATFSGIYRVDTTTNTTVLTRPIYRIAMSGVPNIFPAGSYWVAWMTTGSITSGPWANPKVLANGNNPANQNALSKFTGTGSQWRLARDSGVQGNAQIGYNFILKGRLNPVGIEDAGSTKTFQLHTPFPNPASGSANLSFSLAGKSHIRLQILNAIGQQVATVAEDEMTAGEYMIPFNTSNLAAGVYNVVLRTETGNATVPMTVK